MTPGRWKNVSGALLSIPFGSDVITWEVDETRTLTYTSMELANAPEFVAAVGQGYLVSQDAVQDDGAAQVAIVGRQGAGVALTSHCFTDRCTWWSESERVTEEALADSGDGLTFNSLHDFWIDLTHGRIFDEEVRSAEQPVLLPTQGVHNYAVVVTSDGSPMTARPPFATDWSQGGDYYVDYENGDVVFQNSQAGKTVLASYSYEDGSTWIYRPPEGYKLDIEGAELQYSEDLVLTTTMTRGVWGPVEIFDPPQAVSNGGPIPDGTKILICGHTYKRLRQLYDEIKGALPALPAMGGGARGNAEKTQVLPMPCITVNEICDSKSMEIRMFLEGDTPYTGERATFTIYGTKHAE